MGVLLAMSRVMICAEREEGNASLDGFRSPVNGLDICTLYILCKM